MKKWKLLGSKMAFDNKWFKVRQDKVRLVSGRVLDDYFVWLEGDVSMVVPITKNQEFVFVKQYKHAAGEIMIEFPAGLADEGEAPQEAAERELLEETGFSGEISMLTKLYKNPTKAVGRTYVYLLENAVQGKKVEGDDNEEIEVVVVPYKKALEMVRKGEIWAAETVASIYVALDKLHLPLL